MAIFDFVKNGVGNAVINAKAGSAKTTTAEEALHYIPIAKQVLFIAFNKTIAEKLQNDCRDLPNIKAMTYHSLGFSILRENIGMVRLNEYKYKSFITSNISRLSDGFSDKLTQDAIKSYIFNVIRLTDLSRYNLAQSEDEISTMCVKYGVELLGNEIESVLRVLEWGKGNTDTIDYTDMEWLPVELGFETRRHKYDWVIIDEAQDSSIVQQTLVKKCFRRGTRFMALGDAYQSINGWCGGDSDAFDNFLKSENTIQLDLPISYRCSKRVIELAQTIVPDIKPYEGAKEGSVEYDCGYYSVKNGDMVLCRNTVPLMKLYSEYIKRGIRCFVRGTDTGQKIEKYVDDTKCNVLGSISATEGVIPTLYNKLWDVFEKIKKENTVTDEEVVQSERFTELYEVIKTVEILSENITSTQELKDRLMVMFSDTVDDGVCLSTIHKAKGLEADNVYILCPSLMPSALAVTPEALKAEEHLRYVAITRAKDKLFFISETFFSPHKGYADSLSALDDIETIKNLHNKIVKKEKEKTLFNTPKEEEKPETAVPPKPKKIGAMKFQKFLR